MLGSVNLAKQLRNLACRRVNLTILSSTGNPVQVSFCWWCVDDIVITGSDSTGISSLKSFLHG